MESFSINLNQMSERGGRYKRYIILSTLIFIVLSVASFAMLYRRHDPREWVFLLIAAYAVVFFYFIITGYKAKLFINGDDFALEYQFNFFMKTPNKIIWQTITNAKIGPTYLAFYKRSGKRKLILLGWLPYAKVVEIKEKVNSICQAKGISVQVVEYQKG